jgi:hypothetical protein
MRRVPDRRRHHCADHRPKAAYTPGLVHSTGLTLLHKLTRSSSSRRVAGRRGVRPDFEKKPELVGGLAGNISPPNRPTTPI